MAAKKENGIPDEELNIEEYFSDPIIIEVNTPKLETVVPLVDFTCNIAKQWYTFHKGVPQKVSPSVKQRLLRGKKIKE